MTLNDKNIAVEAIDGIDLTNELNVREKIESKVRKDKYSELLQHELPTIAADLENKYAIKHLRLQYEPIIQNMSPMIEVTATASMNMLKFLVILDSPSVPFLVGSKHGGRIAYTANAAAQLISTLIEEEIQAW